MVFEDTYHGERPSGSEVIPRLIAEMRSAADLYTRGKFAELLGEMGDASVVPYLIEELSCSDTRLWAVFALHKLGDAAGVRAAAACRIQHPEASRRLDS